MPYTPHYNSNTCVLCTVTHGLRTMLSLSQCSAMQITKFHNATFLVTNKSANLVLKQHFIAIIRIVQYLSGTFPHLLALMQGQRSSKAALCEDLMYLSTFPFH